MEFVEKFFQEGIEILKTIPREPVAKIVQILAEARSQEGRVFVLGVGGSAATASHFVNDLRKIVHIEAYCATDNAAELTARTNDDGWENTFNAWLKGCHIKAKDVVFILSVGGGDAEKNISPNLVRALDTAKEAGARIVGIVGRTGGYTAKVADAAVIVPTVNPDHVTPHTESFHSVVGHAIVTHPGLKAEQTKWESATGGKKY
jgi:D-sedoheptulose 7-phosphate isomerase